ncbi:hypothetical protein N657DRAFT_682070 [Parathielavia appendiculata]|uniref:Uncharacterized protein n=1 Tax=Parathielavia appendiculata TaxID=2587402 RepID=A0AAN6Z1M9_9PEZI|nr:hypothetical protein N657DRAFT_682070 [Parathielavia appendiculata]
MLGGPAYVIQQAQPPQPVKEEKSWFGKLWRSESVKKPAAGHAVNSANKLQKSARPQAPPVFPPPLHPAVSQGTPTSPHMMYPFQQGQQALNPQQPSGPQFRQQHQHQQPLQHQQQHKPPLAWKTVNNSNGNGNGNGNRMPQFHAPNLNPNQSVLPPPEVRQAIQQQEQRLNPVRPESTGLGLAQAQAQAQSVDSIHRGGQHAASSVPVPVQVQGEAKAAPAAAAVGPGNAGASRWGNANASSGGYDGSGWGDDDEEDFS